MDVYVVKAVEKLLEEQKRSNEALIEEARKQTAWLAHMSTQADERASQRV